MKLFRNECVLLCDVLNGTIMPADSPEDYPEGINKPTMIGIVQDAVRLDGVDHKWGVNAYSILSKLGAMSEDDIIALIRSARFFWDGCEEDDRIEKAFAGIIGDDVQGEATNDSSEEL